MSASKNAVTWTVIALLAFVALILGLFVSQHLRSKQIDVSQFHGTLLEKPREIEPFTLTSTENTPFSNENLKGQWTLVFFGFTNCGYLCPTTMGELGKMYRRLEEMSVKPLPRVVMISVDPERDSLEKLHHYVRAFDAHFLGARGEDAIIKQMTREMGIAYSKIPNEKNSTYYEIEHSGAVMLFNPKGELSAFFTTPHHADLLVKDYQLLVS
ncbi:MAG: SCO family protein [Tatlockia sp.]|jgi:protein SCO1/2